MDWISKLERKFGRFAIHNLMLYVIILYIVGFVISLTMPGLYYQYLSLDAAAILHGEVWRLVTFVIQPPSDSIIFVFFALQIYYMIGKSLEASWGAFRFNLYFFSGVLFHILAAVITYLITDMSLPLGTFHLNMSLFFAFAALYPNVEFLLFFFLPVKVKYLAIVDGLFFAYSVLQAFMPGYGGDPVNGIIYKANALAAVVSLLNFALFYLFSRNMKPYSPKEMRRKKKFKSEMKKAERRNPNAPGSAKHCCAVCGKTELTDPNAQFRYCSKCNGNYEYCEEHLFTHEHVK